MKAGAADAPLTPLFFHYASYLLLSCSREDSPLPANLQGIWNDDRACRMGWTCDFHLDVNTQMNYWPAEVCNLAECHEPPFRLVESLRAPGRRTATLTYGCRGWHTATHGGAVAGTHRTGGGAAGAIAGGTPRPAPGVATATTRSRSPIIATSVT